MGQIPNGFMVSLKVLSVLRTRFHRHPRLVCYLSCNRTFSTPSKSPVVRDDKTYPVQLELRWRQDLDSSSEPPPPRLKDVHKHLAEFREWKKEKGKEDTREKLKYNWTAALAAAIVATVIAAFPIYMISLRQQPYISKFGEDVIGKPDLGGDWTLVNHNGKVVSSDELKGKYQLIYFGFTYCPDICPEELEKMTRVVEILDRKFGEVVQPIFITIDPARDTVAQMEAYCKEFHPRLLGLTGSPEQIKIVARLFRVYYNQGIRTEDEDYLVDHSIIQYMMDRRGKFLDFFGKNMTSTEIADKISKHITADLEKAKQKKKKAISDETDL